MDHNVAHDAAECVVEDVLLGTVPVALEESAEDYSVTRSPTNGVTIYTHGCSVRLRLKADPARAGSALAGCTWLEDPGSDWIVSCPGALVKRWVMRGSRWLDERPPRNVRLPLARWNDTWRTRLYSLGIERKDNQFHVDLQVIRYRDLTRFMEEVLRLGSAQWEIVYYRVIERYTALAPHVAHALADELGTPAVVGRGRQGRKRWLVRGYEIPITVRKSARATAHLFVYRIDRGATAHYRAEIRLCGKRRDRGHFLETDVPRLDAVLLELINKYDLRATPKPARWEPRTFATPVEQSAFEAELRRLPQRAWRGSRVGDHLKRAVEKCHTPPSVGILVSERNDVTFGLRPRIRSKSLRKDSVEDISEATWELRRGGGFNVTHYFRSSHSGPAYEDQEARSPRMGDAYSSVAADIVRTGLYLHEVLLDADDCPERTLNALTSGVLGRVGVAALCAFDNAGQPETWPAVKVAVRAHPFDQQCLDTLVLVVDHSAIGAIAAAVMGANESEPEFTPDGEVIGDLQRLFSTAPLPSSANTTDPSTLAMAAWMDDSLRELRAVGEQSGIRIVLITSDTRPEHGLGNLEPGHFIHDTRVRSSIGDAGRYHAHQRYRIERRRRTKYIPGRIERSVMADGDVLVEEYLPYEVHEYVAGEAVVIKDEAEGLTGRLVYVPTWGRRRR